MKYTIELTAAEINNIKRAIGSYENELFNDIEDIRNDTGEETSPQIEYKQRRRKQLTELHQNISQQTDAQY